MATNIVGATGIDKVQDGIIVNADIDTVAASKLTGALPAISGASLTNLPADATKLPLAGGTMTGDLTVSSASGLDGATPPTIKINSTSAGTWTDNATFAKLAFGSEDTAGGIACSINAYVDSTSGNNSGLTFYTSASANTPVERMRIDKGGNVGIGETSPATPLHITGSGSLGSGIRLEHTNDNGYAEIYTSAQSALIFDADPGNTDNGTPIVFKVDGTEHMRIDYEGSTTWGTWGYSNNCVYINVGGKRSILMGVDTTSSTNRIRFANSNGYVGNIATSGSGTSYGTSSDYRLKENVDYTWDATTRLKQLKPARFNFKADDSLTLDGFLAHEVSSIVPEAVIGEKDATEMQCIDQSKLVPLLVKTIQELEARLTAGGL